MTYPPQNPQGAPQGQPSGWPQQNPAQQYPQQHAPGQPGTYGQQEGHGRQPGQQQPGQQQPNHAHQGYAGQQGYGAPAQARPNPFANTPISDWIRDGVAVVLPLVSLALPWSLPLRGQAGSEYFVIAATRVEVLLITLLSVISVAIGYLARAGVFGAGFTPTRAALTRALLNIPYVLLVLLYIVFDAVKFTDYGNGSGLGAAAGVGLAGALFAAVPRRYEIETPEFANSAAKVSFTGAILFFSFAAAATLLGLVLSLITYIDFASSTPFEVSYGFAVFGALTLDVVKVLAILAIMLFVLRRSETARLIAVAFGIAAILALHVVGFSKQGVIESAWSTFGYPVLLLGASTAVFSSSGLPYAMRQQPSLNSWYGAVRFAPLTIIIGGGLIAVWSVLRIVSSGGEQIGFTIGILICAVLAIVAALILRMQIVSNFQQSRLVAACITSGIALLGLVSTILAGVDNDAGFNAIHLDLALPLVIFFAPVGLLFYALFVPATVRGYFASFAAPRQDWSQQAQGGEAYGQQYDQQGGQQYGRYAQQEQQDSGQAGLGQGISGEAPEQGSGQHSPDQQASQERMTPYAHAVQQTHAQQDVTTALPTVPEEEPQDRQDASQASEDHGATDPALPVTTDPETPREQDAASPGATDSEPPREEPDAAEPQRGQRFQPPAPPAPAPQHPPEAARAADPSTPATDLHAMAQQPELWPYLALNPSLYPDLEEWLASTGDEATLQALARRRGGHSSGAGGTVSTD